jgi:hypothetical protein
VYPENGSLQNPDLSLKLAFMDKVYLLLRDNQQTGPFTIGELLQQQLLPTDMLWIEGRSTAWAYLSEMELQPSINKAIEARTETVADPSKRTTPSPTPSISEKNISNRRYAPDDIENKAEELRKRALNYTPQSFHRVPEKTTEESLSSRPVIVNGEEMIDFVDHREEKKLPAAEIVTGILVTAFIAACIVGGKTLFQKQEAIQPALTTRVLSSDEHTAKTVSATPLPKDTASLAPIAVQPPVDSMAVVKRHKAKTTIEKDSSLPLGFDQNSGTTEPATKSENVSANTQQQVTAPPVEKPAPILAEKKTEVTEKKTDDVKKDIVPQTAKETNNETVVTQPEEKKKGLGQALKGIFKKKKKEEDQ